MQDVLDPLPDVEFLAVQALEFPGFPPRLREFLLQLADADREIFVFRQKRANPFFYKRESVVKVFQVVLFLKLNVHRVSRNNQPFSRQNRHGFPAR